MAAYLSVEGTDCPHCAIQIHNALLSLESVLTVKVFLKQGIAAVFYDPERISLDDLIKVVTATGGDDCYHSYRVELIRQMSVAQAYRLMREASQSIG